MPTKFVSAAEAVAQIPDDATIAITGGGGGLCEAMTLQSAVEKRFLETGHPRNLSLFHALGIGNRKDTGVSRFAHQGMVRKVTGGHWVWSPRMQEMAKDNAIEAYVLPGGVAMQLMREIAAKRPGLITPIGLGTFIDPRVDGGRMNQAATDDVCEVITLDGQEYLRYFTQTIDVCLLKGSIADEDGNISLDEEPANLDTYAIAAAVHNSGGTVIFQVRDRVQNGDLGARQVRIPSAIVDFIVIDPQQGQAYETMYDPSISGQARHDLEPVVAPPMNIRRVIANRAKTELRPGMIVNFGFGIPDEIASLVEAEGIQDQFYQTIEHGTYGGRLMTGNMFGYSQNASCMIDGPSQFDFYTGGGLDIAFLGFGQIDAQGNVNASMLGGLPVGPGGFIDIAQSARKVVFVGTFDAKGGEYKTGHGRLDISRNGSIQKFVKTVDQITFSGRHAMKQNQEVLIVTERAVFQLEDDGLHLIEVAPGVDVEKDILGQMEFQPIVKDRITMDAEYFIG